MATDTQVTNTIATDLAWARHHLFLLGAVAVLVFVGIYGVESLLAKRAHEQYLEQQTILKTFTEQNAQIQQQTKAEIDALAQQNVILQQQFTALASAIAARDAQLIVQRQQIKTLPPPQLAIKWGEVANEPAPQVDSNGNAIVPLPLAQKSVDALIQVPVLTQDVKDLKNQLTQQTTIAYNNDQKYQDEVKSHKSDNETNAQTVKTKDSEIKDLKAAARKRNIIIAVIAGALGFGLGHKY